MGLRLLALGFVLLATSATADVAGWRQVGTPTLTAPITSIRAMVVDPLTPTTLYVAESNAGIETQPPLTPIGHGVLKSIDGGVTWTAANTGLTNPYVVALAIDPTSPGTLYAGTDGDGVFVTTDGGDTSSGRSTVGSAGHRSTSGSSAIKPTRSRSSRARRRRCTRETTTAPSTASRPTPRTSIG